MFCSLKRAKCTFFFKKIEEKFGNSEKSSTFALAFRGMLLSNRKNCGNSSVGRAQPCQGWGRGSESRFPLDYLFVINQDRFKFRAQVAELVDAHVSGACVSQRAGSSPVLGTMFKLA